MSMLGWRIMDNDPRMTNRVLAVVEEVRGAFGCTHVRATDNMGRKHRIRTDRVFTDGNPRSHGFNLHRGASE